MNRDELAQAHYETAAAAKAAAAELLVARKALERQIAGLERELARTGDDAGERLRLASMLAGARANREALEARRVALSGEVAALRLAGKRVRKGA